MVGCSGLVPRLRQGLTFFVVNDRLMMRGKVIARTPAAFADVLAQNPAVRTLVLKDMREEHDADAVREMGYDIRARGLDTALQSDSAVYGAAVDLFLSGLQRSMIEKAEIGQQGGGADDARRRFLNDMLGSDAFYGFALLASPADEIHIMSKSEISLYGLLTAPVVKLV